MRVNTAAGIIAFGEVRAACRIGRGGAVPAARKCEGDGGTPLGVWPLRTALLRRDRGIAPPVALPWRWIDPADGWSDDPSDPSYNRPIRHPHRFSAERLWRDDDRYDAIVTIGHNDTPPCAGKGSAIFLHLIGVGPTAGCVAMRRDTMCALLAVARPGDIVAID